MTTSDSNSLAISKTQCFSPGTVPEALHYFGRVFCRFEYDNLLGFFVWCLLGTHTRSKLNAVIGDHVLRLQFVSILSILVSCW